MCMVWFFACMVWFFAGKDCHGGRGWEGVGVACLPQLGGAGRPWFDPGVLHFQGDTLVECPTYVWSDFLVVGVFVRVGVAG